MELLKAVLKQARPYQQDKMSLPVNDLEAALPFYLNTLGFQLETQHTSPHKSAILTRDAIRIGLAENGGDPTQDGCFFEVDNVLRAADELRAHGLKKKPEINLQRHGDVNWKVFFVVAPDGLCYSYGERQHDLIINSAG